MILSEIDTKLEKNVKRILEIMNVPNNNLLVENPIVDFFKKEILGLVKTATKKVANQEEYFIEGLGKISKKDFDDIVNTVNTGMVENLTVIQKKIFYKLLSRDTNFVNSVYNKIVGNILKTKDMSEYELLKLFQKAMDIENLTIEDLFKKYFINDDGKPNEFINEVLIGKFMKRIKEVRTKSFVEEVKGKHYKYEYETCGFYSVGTTKQYYFNKLKKVEDPNPILGKIKLVDKEGKEYLFDENYIKFGDDNYNQTNLKINKSDAESSGVNMEELLRKSEKDKIKFEKVFLTNSNIKKSLKKAFSKFWKETDENSSYVSGIWGFEPIGKYINTEDEWSIINFFDSQSGVKNRIYDLVTKNGTEIPETAEETIKKISEILKDKKILDELIEIQKRTFLPGFKNESETIEILKNKNIISDTVQSGFGAKIDIEQGVDLIATDIKNNVTQRYQIKKTYKPYKDKSGNYIVKSNNIGKKKYKENLVDKYIFNNEKDRIIYVFDNLSAEIHTNYIIFKNPPTEIISY